MVGVLVAQAASTHWHNGHHGHLVHHHWVLLHAAHMLLVTTHRLLEAANASHRLLEAAHASHGLLAHAHIGHKRVALGRLVLVGVRVGSKTSHDFVQLRQWVGLLHDGFGLVLDGLLLMRRLLELWLLHLLLCLWFGAEIK